MSRVAARSVAAARLAVRFLAALLRSGMQTAWVIVAHGLGRRAPASQLLHMPYPPLSGTGAALYACLISLTPGTTVIDVDEENRHMLVHALDVTDPQALFASLARDFEGDLKTLFGADHAG